MNAIQTLIPLPLLRSTITGDVKPSPDEAQTVPTRRCYVGRWRLVCHAFAVRAGGAAAVWGTFAAMRRRFSGRSGASGLPRARSYPNSACFRHQPLGALTTFLVSAADRHG